MTPTGGCECFEYHCGWWAVRARGGNFPRFLARVRRDRERREEWRRTLEFARRTPAGELVPAPGLPSTGLPAYVGDGRSLGPSARARLRPLARAGRVLAAGIDTWSPCWYAEPGGGLWRAMRALARVRTRQAWLLEEPVAGYRVGWFEQPGLVFAEGSPAGSSLCEAAAAATALGALLAALADRGIPVAECDCAGLRRLDVAVEVATDSGLEGLGILECVGRQAHSGAGKVAVYRGDRCLESVVLRTRGGRTLARLYDKGVETGAARRGDWLRLEAQWRLPRAARLDPRALGGVELRERFARRFRPFWQGAEGFRLGGIEAISSRLQEAVQSGQLPPSRARSIAGYLVLAAAGVPQGARRTTSELERECRELGLSLSLAAGEERSIDVATVLDECLDPSIWQ